MVDLIVLFFKKKKKCLANVDLGTWYLSLLSWQVVLHCGGASVAAAVEESRRDGPGGGERQPSDDWLMCWVRGYQ